MRLVRREFEGLHQAAFKRFQERADFVAHLAGCVARDRSTGHRSDVHEIVDELLYCVFARGADPYTMMTSAQEQFQSRAVRLLPCGPVCRVAERRPGSGHSIKTSFVLSAALRARARTFWTAFARSVYAPCRYASEHVQISTKAFPVAVRAAPATSRYIADLNDPAGAYVPPRIKRNASAPEPTKSTSRRA